MCAYETSFRLKPGSQVCSWKCWLYPLSSRRCSFSEYWVIFSFASLKNVNLSGKLLKHQANLGSFNSIVHLVQEVKLSSVFFFSIFCFELYSHKILYTPQITYNPQILYNPKILRDHICVCVCVCGVILCCIENIQYRIMYRLQNNSIYRAQNQIHKRYTLTGLNQLHFYI